VPAGRGLGVGGSPLQTSVLLAPGSRSCGAGCAAPR
jgi:hypothetical protein